MADGFVPHVSPGPVAPCCFLWRGGFVLRFSIAWRGLARFGGLMNAARRHRDTEGKEIGVGVVGRAHIEPLLERRDAARLGPCARSKSGKGGFSGGYRRCFFYFSKLG